VNYNTIAKSYPNRYVIISPNKVNKLFFVVSWKVLNTTRQLSKAYELQDFYTKQGINGVVVMDTAEEADLPPNKIAEFFRVMFALN
jgi:hypothetical protein